MNLAVRIAAAILSVPPDALAPLIPMMAPPPRNVLEFDLRNEVDSALSGHCSSADGAAPLFVISPEESNYVDCNSGRPMDGSLFRTENSNADTASPEPSTYGEVTSLGSRQLFHHMGLTNYIADTPTHHKPNYQFYDLGSGGGRLVIQSYLELPSVLKSVGIELSPSRHEIATQTWDSLKQNGDVARIRNLARKSWGIKTDNENISSAVELHEGDLFKLDISEATHIYVSSLCFSEDMLERLVGKIEREGSSLEMVASLRLLPSLQDGTQATKNHKAEMKRVTLGNNPWMEFVEMSWTKARGDGCPVYFYSVKHLNGEEDDEKRSFI